MRDTSSGGARANSTGTGVGWTQVRDAAVRAVRRGWPVTPGVCRPDDLGFPEVVPLEDSGDLAPITDPERAEELWTQRRHVGLLLVCGHGVDALEVPFRIIELLPALQKRGLVVPVATTLLPSRWLLLTATGSGTLRPDLAAASVCLHGIGQWVALPPTTLGGYPPLQWRAAPPNDPEVRLPGADEVQQVLADALSSEPRRC